MNETEINALLDAAKPAIIKSLQDELTKSISYDVKHQASAMIAAHCKKWIEENIIPEITKELVESKSGLISLGARISTGMMDELVRAATTAISENLKNSWTRKELFTKLLG